ncbi:hypothetical protein QIA25_00470 (plasmid) [Borreliella spielmanii]|uniref:Uncharacterized protein n=2 Tax=Borreliella spielmanii TaxID=88916 RepID=C0RC50_9SPIR|nr:hypothetical protein [Borreliella spielmanii]ACN53348.1 conserved hypothetical protein [Borreliella spielmanii A14S]MBB6031889.1 hypothetical protein [Borreliella spielmanii]WKC83080.1 hypothetical protein QIA25_00470 [Borreliella spielmanii]
MKIRFKDICSFNTENSINIKSEELEKEITFKLAKVAYKEFYSNIFSNKGIKTTFRKSIQKGLVEIKDQFRVFCKNYLLSRQELESKRSFNTKEFKSLINNIEKRSLLKTKEKDSYDCRAK